MSRKYPKRKDAKRKRANGGRQFITRGSQYQPLEKRWEVRHKMRLKTASMSVDLARRQCAKAGLELAISCDFIEWAIVNDSGFGALWYPATADAWMSGHDCKLHLHGWDQVWKVVTETLKARATK